MIPGNPECSLFCAARGRGPVVDLKAWEDRACVGQEEEDGHLNSLGRRPQGSLRRESLAPGCAHRGVRPPPLVLVAGTWRRLRRGEREIRFRGTAKHASPARNDAYLAIGRGEVSVRGSQWRERQLATKAGDLYLSRGQAEEWGHLESAHQASVMLGEAAVTVVAQQIEVPPLLRLSVAHALLSRPPLDRPPDPARAAHK